MRWFHNLGCHWWASSTLISVLLVAVASAQTPAEIKQAAIAAGQARQDKTAGLRVVFEVTRVQGATFDTGPKFLPPVLSTNTFILSGNWVRYEDNSFMRPFRNDPVGLQAREISVFNGLIGKRYFPEMSGTSGDKLGYMVAKGPPRSLFTPFLIPLLFNYRGRDAILASIEIDECISTGSRQTINDRPCAEFKIELAPGRDLFLWLDTERAYVPVRVRRANGDGFFWQLDIRYTPDDVLGWRVAEWSLERPFDNAPVTDIHTAKVTQWERNPTVPDETFELTFPPRTQVYDQETNQQYIVQEDGRLREISAQSGEYLDETPPEEKKPFPRYGYLVCLGALAAVFLVLHLVRSWRSK